MSQKNIFYIVTAAAMAVVIIFMLNTWSNMRKRLQKEAVSVTPVSAAKVKGPVAYDMDKMRPKPAQAPSGAAVSDMKQVYAQFPKEDVGNNIIAKWASLKPEDKAEIREGLDRSIKKSEEALRANPADKLAKHKLVVSKALKKLADNDFNYKAGEQWSPE